MIPGNSLPSGGRFDLLALAATFPDTADTMLVDTYLTDSETRSIRLFRVYQGVPAHYHNQCDEILYVLSGEGTFWIDAPASEAAFAPGQLLVFPKKAIHALPQIKTSSAVFLAIDTPRRAPEDVTFIDTLYETSAAFIARI